MTSADTYAGVPRRVGGRLRRLRRHLADLRPERATANRVPRDRLAPLRHELAALGSRSSILAPIRIEGAAGVAISDDVLVYENAGIAVDASGGARLSIGRGTVLGRAVDIACAAAVDIGEDVVAADNVSITDTWGAPGPPTGSPVLAPQRVVIGARVRLGTSSIVGPGVTIGHDAVVLAGAVVLDDVAPGAVVVGNPAQVLS